MSRKQKQTLGFLFALGLVYFLIFAIVNIRGAADRNMLAVFEPDEFAQYPHVIQMLTPGKSLYQTLYNFIVYRHFYYGYPFYLFSAIVLLPLKLIHRLSATPAVILALRQFVSILPMLLGILLLVYLQTRFRSFWRSLILFLLLIFVPAIVRNDFWWHPDGLTFFFVALTFFFLDRDDLAFRRNFYLAAVACGLAVGTKLIGVFFFLAIPAYIIWGLWTHRIDLRRSAVVAALFVGIMVVTIVVTNPLLLIPQGRAAIIQTQEKQAAAMSFGWDVAYAKGPASWFGIIKEYYGQWFFIALAFAAAIFGAIKSQRRLLYVLILTWVIPFSLYILFFVAIKPRHFFIPIALPLFSCLAVFLPFGEREPQTNLAARIFKWAALALIGLQLVFYLSWDVTSYMEELNKEGASPSIAFYNRLDRQFLACLPASEHPVIYRDVRAYVPPSDHWQVEMKWGLVDYDYIHQLNPDVVVLQQQRILDYTQESVLEAAADQAQMQRTYQFYADAAKGQLNGYQLLLEDDFGVAFARADRYPLFVCSPQ